MNTTKAIRFGAALLAAASTMLSAQTPVRVTADNVNLRAKALLTSEVVAQARYDAGYSPYLEVLTAQRTANDATIAWIQNRQARLTATVDLFKALGGGWKGA